MKFRDVELLDKRADSGAADNLKVDAWCLLVRG